MVIEFDKDIPRQIHAQLRRIITDDCADFCDCGCDEVYVAVLKSKGKTTFDIDVKCYDCGETFAEYSFDIEWP